ncbi:MAG: amidohydrolase [Dehalococcoidia bacterium]
MSKHTSRNTILFNGNVLALDGRDAVATGVWIEDGHIKRVLSGHEGVVRGYRTVDLDGATVLPGFIDPHAHPLALGAALRAVDCSPVAVKSIAQIVGRIAEAAADSPESFGGWIRARGYDELLLADRRHPTAADLDRAAPGRMVRLSHGSGHGDVLSSAALDAVGIHKDSTPPPGATIERDADTGKPTGVLFEMGGWLRERMPRPSSGALNDYAESSSSAIIAAGVTSITDAGRDNTVDRMRLYSGMVAAGRFLPRPTMMLAPGIAYPSPEGVPGVRQGATKIAITFSGGEMHPDFEVLVEMISVAHRADHQIAVHAVEIEAIVMATEAFAAVGNRSQIAGRRHRIEHASDCPPEIAKMIASAGLSVVTQPGFIFERGDRYLSALSSSEGGADPAHLYAIRSLLNAGTTVVGSSDAPFGPMSPLRGIQAAVTRISSSGQSIGFEQAVSIGEALRLYGPDAAWVDLQENEAGSIESGKRADFAVLERDPREVESTEISSISILATLIGGELVFGSLPGL